MSVLVKKIINQTGCVEAPGAGATTTITTFTNPGTKRTLFFEARFVAYDTVGAGTGFASGATLAGGASGAAPGAMFFLSGSTASPAEVVSTIGDDGGSITWIAAIVGDNLDFRVRNSLAGVLSASVVVTGLLVGNT